jgi:hypothetical protein
MCLWIIRYAHDPVMLGFHKKHPLRGYFYFFKSLMLNPKLKGLFASLMIPWFWASTKSIPFGVIFIFSRASLKQASEALSK